MLHDFIKLILPSIISICELIGILIVAVTVVSSFYNYAKGIFLHVPSNAKYQLANGLATSLSFKMAGELLKTVIVNDWSELLMLGVIILLRAMMSVMLHFETKHSYVHVESAQAKNEAVDEMEVAAGFVFDAMEETDIAAR